MMKEKYDVYEAKSILDYRIGKHVAGAKDT